MRRNGCGVCPEPTHDEYVEYGSIKRGVKVAQCVNAAKDARGGVNARKGLKVLAAREEQGPPIIVIGTVFAVIGPKFQRKKYAPVLLRCKSLHCYLLQYHGIMY